MGKFLYSEWDGTQDLFEMDAEALMQELERNMNSYGNLSRALREMQRGGMRDSQGRRLPSIQDLLQRLKQMRQNKLDRYKMDSGLNEIREKLDNILKMEREGIQRRLEDSRQKAAEGTNDLDPEMQQKLLQTIEDIAAKNIQKLDELPPDVGGRIKELSQYNFMDDEAARQFRELMDMLKKNAVSSYARDLMQKFQNMDANALSAIRHMVEALNRMLEQRMRGEEPDFQDFMNQFGDFFGPEPPQNLDELIERLQHQMAQAQSLLDSMSPEQRQELQDLLSSMLDQDTQMELARLASQLEALYPSEDLRQRYAFSGEETLSYQEALKLMEELQKMEELEEQFKESQYNHSLENIDENLVKQLIGDESAEELERLRQITKVLEEAGYIRLKNGKYELTPRGIRKIGQKALQNIFANLRKDRIGGHNLNRKGGGGDRTDETKKYDFGDDLHLHIQRTIMNAICREPGQPPVRMKIDDFEIFQTESTTRSSTALLIDLSLSMPMRGNFEPAKRVALALDHLIRTQFPKDSLYLIGFSSYGRQIKKEDLARMDWDEFDPYTNLQHGLYVARKLLSRDVSTNKQIILISDGEPTAHFEGEHIYFRHPPTLRTLQMTLKEVRKCTQKDITINMFMLDNSGFLDAFVNQIARINKGRIFYTSPDDLGKYLLVDFITNKKKRIQA
jgi:uncharacterized protein with von Willebrand factor type A (vWA) domain